MKAEFEETRRASEGGVRKHCKVICRGVSRENREVLTSLVPSPFPRPRGGARGGEEPRPLSRDAATHGCRTDEWMDGRMMPRSDGLPKGWLYYARRFSARPGVKRSKIAPAVTISRRVAALRRGRGAVKNCGVCHRWFAVPRTQESSRVSIYSRLRLPH